MDIMAAAGGIPGKDCGGFCEFCYFKSFDYKKLENISCRFCPPNQQCIFCHDLKNFLNGFYPPKYIIMNLKQYYDKIRDSDAYSKDLYIMVESMGDMSYYPHLKELITEMKQFELPIHIMYGSGKGLKDEKMIEDFLKLNVDEVSFSVISCDPEIRRKWMHDKSPEASLKAVEMFSENMDVHASTVVIPGVTDLEELLRTGSTLEEWGVKSFHLMRFANFKSQGNILNNRPIIDGIIPHSIEEFQSLVKKVANEFNFSVVLGYPLFYPENDLPYILSNNKYKSYLRRLPNITSEATIITSKYSEKYLKKIFSKIDKNSLVNVIIVNKEIGDLITLDDFSTIKLDEVKNKVIIPGNAMMRDDQAEKLLNRDGRSKRIIRGPNALTPIDEYILNKERAIDFELNAFTNLINIINS